MEEVGRARVHPLKNGCSQPSLWFRLTARYYLIGGETRSRGPARCLILEACKFPRRLGSCPRTHYRKPRRLSHAPGPTYVYAVLHSVVCPSPPSDAHRDARCTCHPCSTRFPREGKGRERKKKRAACWCGGQDTNLTLPCFSYCNASCTITCGEGHRGIFALPVKERKRRWWVQVEYQDNYVKCNAGYRKRKGRMQA